MEASGYCNKGLGRRKRRPRFGKPSRGRCQKWQIFAARIYLPLPTTAAIIGKRGCGISTISVCIGAIVWYLIAMFTGFELGIIAWMLGGAAGVGMAVGCGENGTNAITGLLAAIIAFLGIFAARMAIILTIIIPMALAAAGAVDDQLAREEGFGEEATLEEVDVDVVPPEGNAPAVEEASAQETVDEKPALDGEADMEGVPQENIGLGGIVAGLFAFFGLLMFGGLWQAIFVILACATAFRVGRTGVLDND